MTNYFKWGQPETLVWLWLVPFVALLAWRAIHLRLRAARQFVAMKADQRLGLPPMTERLYLKSGLLILSLLLLIVAIARPQVGLHRERAQRKGADIMLVIDTSLSMQARDMQPNRLDAAKVAASNLVNRLPNDRFGIVVFSGDAHLYCPITIDHDAVQMFLDSIVTQSSPQPGTALSNALREASSSLANSESKHRAIVILTDGEDHASDTLSVAEKAVRETAATMHVIGFGSAQGEPIPILDDSGNLQGFKQDEKGQTVLSKLGEVELRKLAQIGKGMYYRALDQGAIDELASRLEALEGAQVGTMLYTEYGERFQWPLALALLLLAIEAILPERGRRKHA